MENANVGGLATATYPDTGGNCWPQTWPQTWTFPTHSPSEEYANEVEIERGEHDAVLRFHRKRGKLKTLIKEITVPLGLLEVFAAKPQTRKAGK